MDKSKFFVQKLLELPKIEVSKIGNQTNYRLYRPAEMIAKYFKQVELIPTSKASIISVSTSDLDHKMMGKSNVDYEAWDFGQDKCGFVF